MKNILFNYTVKAKQKYEEKLIFIKYTKNQFPYIKLFMNNPIFLQCDRNLHK